jgi:hypothetical protein
MLKGHVLPGNDYTRVVVLIKRLRQLYSLQTVAAVVPAAVTRPLDLPQMLLSLTVPIVPVLTAPGMCTQS